MEKSPEQAGEEGVTMTAGSGDFSLTAVNERSVRWSGCQWRWGDAGRAYSVEQGRGCSRDAGVIGGDEGLFG